MTDITLQTVIQGENTGALCEIDIRPTTVFVEEEPTAISCLQVYTHGFAEVLVLADVEV
jgi:hypothetical protein